MQWPQTWFGLHKTLAYNELAESISIISNAWGMTKAKSDALAK
jgi:hypothetical protein